MSPQLHSQPYLESTFQPIPVLALVKALPLKLCYIATRGITIVLSPVRAIAVILSQIVTDSVRHNPHLVNSLVGVFTPVCVISTGIRGGCSEQEN
jgi:hypothetical protein